MSKHKFTLIEMLVVITIIAILASLIASSVMNSIRAGKIVACGSNLKNQGVAIEMYRNANNQFFPPWLTCTGIDQEGLLRCPLDEKAGVQGGRPNWIAASFQYIYINDFAKDLWEEDTTTTYDDDTRNYNGYSEIRTITPSGCSYFYEFSGAPCWDSSYDDCADYKFTVERGAIDLDTNKPIWPYSPISRCYYHIEPNDNGLLTDYGYHIKGSDGGIYNQAGNNGPSTQKVLNYCINGSVKTSFPNPWWKDSK